MKRNLASLVVGLLLVIPALAQGPVRGAIHDTTAIGRGLYVTGEAVTVAGVHAGKIAYRAGKHVVHFTRWLFS